MKKLIVFMFSVLFLLSCEENKDVIFKTDFSNGYILEFENLDDGKDIADFEINIPAESYETNYEIKSGKYKVTFKNLKSGIYDYKYIFRFRKSQQYFLNPEKKTYLEGTVEYTHWQSYNFDKPKETEFNNIFKNISSVDYFIENPDTAIFVTLDDIGDGTANKTYIKRK
ncbi:hypothetical protein N9X14_00585 [bacterium]|nr:hypothetical protein [bacterium]